jgi:hypothetical protein
MITPYHVFREGVTAGGRSYVTYQGHLQLRPLVQRLAVQLNFVRLQIAYMSWSFAESCGHNPRAQLDPDKTQNPLGNSVVSPVAAEYIISIVLTYGNSEAQSLSGVNKSGVNNVCTIFQGNTVVV